MCKLSLRLSFGLFMVLLPASLPGPAASANAQGGTGGTGPAATEAREPARASRNQSESGKPDLWNRLETISRILSIAAIPIVVALGGWLVQRQLQKQSVSKDYVQLAISILRAPEVSSELRSWAVDLLNAYSVVKLSAAGSKVLKAGDAVLPPLEGFEAKPSPALTGDLEEKIRRALTTFQKYLIECGFSIPSAGTIQYEIVPGDVIETDQGEYYAFYDADIRSMKVASAYAADTDLIRHEYMRHVLDPDNVLLDKLTEDPGWWNWSAVSSGLATYFPCSFKSSSIFVAKHAELRVELNNERKFRRRAHDMITADDIGDRVWAGAFWELREKIGDPKLTDRLLASTWVAWQPTDPSADLFVEFAHKLIESDQSQNSAQHVTDIQETFRQRGLKI